MLEPARHRLDREVASARWDPLLGTRLRKADEQRRRDGEKQACRRIIIS